MNEKLSFLYEEFTNKITKALDEALEKAKRGEKVILPWQMPYALGHAKNPVTKTVYQGINSLGLSMTDFKSPYWLTFKNIEHIEGRLKPTETKKYQHVVFWKMSRWSTSSKDADTGEEQVTYNTVPLMRYTNVWNLDQLESWNTNKLKLDALREDAAERVEAEAVVTAYKDRPQIRIKAGVPNYAPGKDLISIPEISQFKTDEEYYSTLFHELAHSTGHKSRLAREGIVNHDAFGSHRYSVEELVAEFTASFLCAYCGIENVTLDNSIAYIQGWAKKFLENKKLILHASQQAQKAANWILGQEREQRLDDAA